MSGSLIHANKYKFIDIDNYKYIFNTLSIEEQNILKDSYPSRTTTNNELTIYNSSSSKNNKIYTTSMSSSGGNNIP